MLGLLFAFAMDNALSPMRSALTVPAHKTRLHLHGGLSIVRIDLPSLPVLPIFTGGAEVAHGVTSFLDLRLWLRSDLGLVNRLGGELRVRAFSNHRIAIGARIAPSAQLAGSIGQRNKDADYSGDFSTEASLLVSILHRRLALTADAGLSVQWAMYESMQGQRRTDITPLPRYVNLAVEAEWTRRNTQQNLTLRLEINPSLIAGDPFSIYGVFPRLLIGSSFGL